MTFLKQARGMMAVLGASFDPCTLTLRVAAADLPEGFAWEDDLEAQFERGSGCKQVILRKLRGHFKKMSPEEVAEGILFLAREGMTPQEIATETGASIPTIYRCMSTSRKENSPAGSSSPVLT